jgi:hypothetical protein
MLGKHICDAIEEDATEWPADLIVIGTHGRKGIRRLLLGSVAEGLTRVSSKPMEQRRVWSMAAHLQRSERFRTRLFLLPMKRP